MTGAGIEAVLLAGPTASGKSALAMHLAERLNGVVINTDSMQVYADLAVVTARPHAADMARVPHRLYGHIDGAANHSVAHWRDEAARELASCRTAGCLPIFVGGTGLYFKALEQGLADIPAIPDDIRASLRGEAEAVPSSALHERLQARDPVTAARLDATDRQRILRALEVEAATGRPLSDWHAAPNAPPLVDPARSLRLFLAPERATLYSTIDNRFDAMIAAGVLDEVARLGARGLDPGLPVMRAHGVPWLLQALSGSLDLAKAAEHSKTDTRHYAKRQFTWFRHQMAGWTMVAPQDARAVAEAALAANAVSD